MALTLIGGGGRSGKSTFALQLARELGPRRAFIATAEAFDDEMRTRIAHHRAERPDFTTIEEPLDLARALSEAASRFDVIVVDCLTLWVSNLMLRGNLEIEKEFCRLLDAIAAPTILVTNEVGCGIVPDNALARQFRDLAGRVNQRAAARADIVYYMAFGLPIKIKG